MNTTMKPVPRSMLFTPATKASHFDKAAEVGADAVILDLEDSVPTAAKDQARRAALNYLGSDRLSEVQTALRINAPATLAGWQDLTALLQSSCDPDFVVIPKAESAAVAGLVKSLLAQARKAARVVVIYESARAVTHIGALLDPRVVDAVMLGTDDLSADLGADGQAEVTAYARNVLLTHAAAVAIPVIDSPFSISATMPGLSTRPDAPLPRDSPARPPFIPGRYRSSTPHLGPTSAKSTGPEK
jgi:(S)-citramalyl-CoA lyase